MALYHKQKNVSYQYMRNFVDQWKLGDDKAKLYKYLYLLIKNHAKENRMFSSADEIEIYTEKASELAYEDILRGVRKDYFSYDVKIGKAEKKQREEKIIPKQDISYKFRAFKFNVDSSKQVKRILSKIPRKRFSCEKINIELSIILTVINLIYGKKGVMLFHTDAVYTEYVRCISNLIYKSIKEYQSD